MGKPQSKSSTDGGQDVIATQIGYENKMDVNNTLVLGHLGQINIAVTVFVGIISLALVFLICRYFNACFNKRVDRRARAIAFTQRITEPDTSV